VGRFFFERGKKKSAIIVTKLGYHVKESWHEEKSGVRFGQ
jgi:hypothetical protein